jgi:hypothetical protein
MVSYLSEDYKRFYSQFPALWYNSILQYGMLGKKEKHFYWLAFDFYFGYTGGVKIYFLFFSVCNLSLSEPLRP